MEVSSTDIVDLEFIALAVTMPNAFNY